MRPLFLDVELSRSGALFGVAALGADGEEAVAERAADVPGVLRTIAGWNADLLVGHNLHRHDRPWLARYAPGHPALGLPWVDTLVLSPLAFPERPYHRLIKEHRLVRESRPAPLADCRATREVFADEVRALARLPAALLDFIRATLGDARVDGANGGYRAVLGGPTPTLESALPPLLALLVEQACARALATITADPAGALALAYVAAWMRVPPGSTLPAWTRAAHPETRALLDALRGTGCGACAWCAAHTPEGWLNRLFGYDAFRPAPSSPTGGSLQRAIVAAGMADQPLYAVLPTGTGKSLCFQIPAAARHRRTGALTVVISPLQSLMKDQVDQLRARDPHATTVNGSLTLPERARALEEVRSGFTSLVYLSPEQLRNPGVRKALATRTIGAWVIDEAHCLTDWGHDFRTDYLYVPRFARELAEGHGQPVPPFQCFTGTSQMAVTDAICALLRAEAGQELVVFDGGAERTNLTFAVEERPAPEKTARMLELLETYLDRGGPGAAIVFCASRRQTEDMAARLDAEGWSASAYHAGLDAELRRDVQDRFIGGALQVIAATSAFGMGVDKPDVRLVVHVEPPGSLEAYLQQAGRAGRDGDHATCVLLFEPGDLDTQFRMATLGALGLRELQALWRGLQRVPAVRGGPVEERVVTRGELARLDVVSERFDPDDPMTDTRLAAAVSWLERAGLFTRDENHTHVFQGRPRYPTMEAAMARVAALAPPPDAARAWERILARLYAAEPDEGLTADALAELAGESESPLGAGTRVLALLQRMVDAGLVTGGAQLSAFLAWGVPDPTRERAARLVATQNALLDALPELANGDDTGDAWLAASPVLLADRIAHDHGLEVTPGRVLLLLRALERDGRGLSDQERSLDLRFVRRDHLAVRPRRSWAEIARLGKLRGAAVARIVDTLEPLAAKPGGHGKAVLVGFEFDTLVRALEGSLLLAGHVRSGVALVDQALLLLHDARALTLHGGLSVFRQAMVLRRRDGAPTQLRKEAIAPLLHHQAQRTLQIHVVGEYARLGAAGIDTAHALTRDWFGAPQDVFLKRWFPGRLETIRRATSPSSYARIIDELAPEQHDVVTARAGGNLLVLAGPGSGKTRVLVHRVAWLVRVRRVRPEGILVVCYTRANAIELRRRLRALIDADARGVTVTTLHGLALRLTGKSPEGGDLSFDGILDDALAILRGQRAAEGADADEIRDLVLRGATHLLVDEYQDLDERQVRLLEAIAGRTHPDASQRLALLAVGDDDQSIFGWRGGSARWVREFGAAWSAEQFQLTTCFRCARPILDAAAALIAPVDGRLKAGVALVARADGEPVRRWLTPAEQVGATVVALVGGADRGALPADAVAGVAVLARTRAALAPVRAALEAAGIPVTWPLPADEALPLPRVREVVRVLDALEARAGAVVSGADIDALVDTDEGPWRALLGRWRDDVRLTHGDRGALGAQLRRALWELLATERGERTLGNGVRLGTLHGAKGLEWPHVVLVDDGEGVADDDARRLWYVGVTRAARRLDLVVRADRPNPLLRGLGVDAGGGSPQGGLGGQAGDPSARVRYALLGLDAVWIDCLGREPDAAGHGVLDHLPFGAPVTLQPRGARTALVAEGEIIAVLTDAAARVWDVRGATLRFVAAIRRTADQSDPAYRGRLRRAWWWVPVCEGRWG